MQNDAKNPGSEGDASRANSVLADLIDEASTVPQEQVDGQEYNTHERLGLHYGIDLSLIDEVAGDVPQLRFDAFGPWAHWLEAAAADSGAPPDYVAGSLLAGASAVCGNARCVSATADGWFTQPSILWVALVGAPSAGKTPGAAAIVEALKCIDRDELLAWEPERLRREGEIVIARATEAAWKDAVTEAVRSGAVPPPMPPDAVAPPPAIAPQILVGDTTGEALLQIAAASPRGMLLYRDELAGLIGGLDRYKGGGSERAMLLEGYGGGEYRVARKGGGATLVRNLSVNVLGGLQPDRFQTLIAKGDDDGLQARFLFVFPQRKPFAGRPLRRTDKARIIDAFRRLRELQMIEDCDGLKPVVIPLTDVAAACFEQWMEDRDAAPPVGTGRFLAWWGKGPGRVLRIALILALLDWSYEGLGHPPRDISQSCLERALYLHDEVLTLHARKTFADAALNDGERHARTIARWIASKASEPPQSISLRELYRTKSLGIHDRDAAHAAMQILADAGWVRAAPSRAGDHPGRRSERYEIPDSLWQCLAELGAQ